MRLSAKFYSKIPRNYYFRPKNVVFRTLEFYNLAKLKKSTDTSVIMIRFIFSFHISRHKQIRKKLSLDKPLCKLFEIITKQATEKWMIHDFLCFKILKILV